MWRVLTIVLVLFVSSGCGASSPEDAGEKLEKRLERQLDDRKGPRHAVLKVTSEPLGLDSVWVAGQQESGEAMTAETPFLSASIGKLFVATATLALADDGVLSLEDPITRWVPASELSGLPVAGGDASFNEITIAHLLGHRSGFPDYFVGETKDGEPNILELVVEQPDKLWTRQELLDYTIAHYDPVGRPGEQFLYSDVNYDVMGMVLEAATQKSYEQVVRDEVLDPLGLDQTWYYNSEPAPEGVGPIADVWIERTQVMGYASLSVDQAGGGLATTTRDLERFMRALIASELVSFSDFERYTEDAITDGIDYGYGLWKVRPAGLSWFARGLPEMVGVSGSLGSYVYYIEEYDAVITGTFDQSTWAEKHIQFIMSKVIPILARTEAEE